MPRRQETRAAWGPALCLATLLAAPAAAQQEVTFSPHHHLDGYTKVVFQDYGELYDIAEFERLEGKKVSLDKITELQEQWATQIERVRARIRQIESSPLEKYAYRQERRLKKHPYFQESDFWMIRDHLPFLFYIEKPRKRDKANYESRIIAQFLPWLQELERRFVSDYVTPLKLDRNPDLPCYTIVILERRESYQVYSRLLGANLRWTRAHYDPQQQIAVTHGELFKSAEQQRVEKIALLHEFVHAMQHAHYKGEGFMPKPVWFNEGLADYRATCAGKVPGDLAVPTVDRRQLAVILAMLRSDQGRFFMNSVEDLVTIDGPGYQRVLQKAAIRAGSNAANDNFAGAALDAFYSQSSLFMHFLHTEHRAAIQRYVGAVMTGKSGLAAFATAFGSTDAKKLGQQFVAYVHRAAGKSGQAGGLPDTVGSPVPGIPARPAEPAAKLAPFDPKSLAWRPDEWRAELAVAIGLARRGQLDGAAARLQGIVTPDGDQAAAERVARERDRVSKVKGVRDALLKKGQFVVIEVDGRRRPGHVQGVTNGKILLLRGGRVTKVALAEFGFDDLERERKRLKNVEPWIGGYLELLAGGALTSVRKQLTGSDSGSRGLADDLDDCAALIPLGVACSLVETMAARGIPDDAGAARTMFAELRQLLIEHGQVEAVKTRGDPLRLYAKHLLEHAFDPTDPNCLGVHGKLMRLGRDRVQITYEFQDPAEAGDFVSVPGYLQGVRNQIGKVAADKSEFQMRAGAMQASGQACARMRLPFAAPFVVRYQFSTTGEHVYVGVCDDRYRNHIRCGVVGDLHVFEESTAGRVDDHAFCQVRQFTVDQNYDYEIRHDGKTVQCWVNGQQRTTVQNLGTRHQGHLFLWMHDAGKFVVNRVEIEASMGPAVLADVKRRWVEEQMKGL